ncbi:hypothetical protein DL93DRAFT_385131 [Clavulina sp. PMI_390]|nr:hypothetical protein DL93DRAFT_385131 [Clavulina sp. PMI_390]
MSKASLSSSLFTISDVALGSVGKSIPPSLVVDKSVKYFSTWGGSDKLLMTVQYAAKLIVPILIKRAELQHGTGLRAKAYSPTAEGLTKFAASISATRRVSGLWGILSIIKWLSALERTPVTSTAPAARVSRTLERLQAISMLAFYSLESISFFSSPAAPILPPTLVTPSMSAKAGLWSVRAWGLYTAIQLWNLSAKWKEASAKEASLTRELKSASASEKGDEGTVELGTKDKLEEVKKEKWATLLSLVENGAFAPLIIHWSVRELFSSDLPVNLLSMVAAIAGFQNGWDKL